MALAASYVEGVASRRVCSERDQVFLWNYVWALARLTDVNATERGKHQVNCIASPLYTPYQLGYGINLLAMDPENWRGNFGWRRDLS